MEFVDTKSQPIDYDSVLSNIQSKVKDIKYDEEEENKFEDEDADYYL
jgi:hypothetical protein